MAQSESELQVKQNSRRSTSTSNQMEILRQEIRNLDPMEVLYWEVEKLEACLKEWEIITGVSWSKPRKAHELNNVLEKIKIEEKKSHKILDPNFYMMQALQTM